MIEVKNIEVFDLDRAKRAIKNSYNVGEINTLEGEFAKGAKNLGSNMQPCQSHSAWLKGLLVSFDIKLNLCTQIEFQRYHFIEIIMQQSRMHSIEKMIGCEHDCFTKYVDNETREHIERLYNNYVNSKGTDKQYEAYMKLIHNLPCGIELWATCNTNYLQLKTIIVQRFGHKQREDWMAFIKACYEMPEFRELCGFTDEKWNLENWR